MPDEIRIIVTDESRLDGFEGRFDETMMPVIVAMTEKVSGEAQRNAPVGVRGLFKGSIQPLVEQPSPLTISGFVVSTVPYAAIIEGVDEDGNEVEFGRQPGKAFPNVGELRLWVEKVIGIDRIRARYISRLKGGATFRTDEQLIDEATYGVGKHIVKEGIRPTRPIGNAFRANEALINREIDKAIERIFD